MMIISNNPDINKTSKALFSFIGLINKPSEHYIGTSNFVPDLMNKICFLFLVLEFGSRLGLRL